MRLILASGSPRRRELLTTAGFSFDIMISKADENSGEKDPAKLVEELSFLKALAVQKTDDVEEQDIILGADTVVALEGVILGKPKDAEDAKRMLRMLSGRSHEVFTGVTLLRGEERLSFHEKTEVSVDELTEEEIAKYVASGEPLDKAGAYGIQGLFGKHICGITGDYNNVVGLPVHRVYTALKQLGIGGKQDGIR